MTSARHSSTQAPTRVKFVKICLGVALVSLLGMAVVVGQQPSDVPLTNAAVIKLVKAGFKEKTIIAIIHSRTNRFNMETEQLIQLKRNGVGENVILAMLSQTDSYEGTAEELSDDDFFKDNGNSKRSNNGEQSGSGGSTGIFGSSGGSQSRSSSRGGTGSGQNEGNVTGSATVRILRPPTEAGGATPKLEKTPTLDNDSVVGLVEAGFSEGTIIKRIESSPAAFDLSAAKVEELHRRRVSDRVIAAMNAAMNDKDVSTKPIAPEN